MVASVLLHLHLICEYASVRSLTYSNTTVTLNLIKNPRTLRLGWVPPPPSYSQATKDLLALHGPQISFYTVYNFRDFI